MSDETTPKMAPCPDGALADDPPMLEEVHAAGEDVLPEEIPADVGAQIVQTATMEDFEKMAREEPRFMKQFMDGKATPDEVWRKFVMRGRKCFGCGDPKGAILIRVFMPLEEAWTRNPDLLAQLTMWAVSQGVSSIPTVDFGNPPQPFIRASERVACDRCKVTAERAAAHGPSWCVVEIKRGPGEINPMVRVARGLRK